MLRRLARRCPSLAARAVGTSGAAAATAAGAPRPHGVPYREKHDDAQGGNQYDVDELHKNPRYLKLGAAEGPLPAALSFVRCVAQGGRRNAAPTSLLESRRASFSTPRFQRQKSLFMADLCPQPICSSIPISRTASAAIQATAHCQSTTPTAQREPSSRLTAATAATQGV